MEKRITKSNSIINSSYRLSLNELRIVLYGLSRIDPREEEFPLDHNINIRELAEFYNIGEKDRGSFYDDIKNALIHKFWEREFSYYDDELDKVVKRRWLIEVQYGGRDGILSYSYNPKIKKQLQQLSKKFTSYFLENIANMKSAYAVRLYEISIMHLNASQKNRVTFTKTIEDLKHQLDITNKYEHFFNMKRFVLEIAKRDINKYSDITFNYKVKKIGRSPHEIIFTISRNVKASPSSKEQKLPEYQPMKILPSVIEQAKDIVRHAGTRWDIYNIEQQYYEYVKTKGQPEDFHAAFIGFVRKKVQSPP